MGGERDSKVPGEAVSLLSGLTAPEPPRMRGRVFGRRVPVAPPAPDVVAPPVRDAENRSLVVHGDSPRNLGLLDEVDAGAASRRSPMAVGTAPRPRRFDPNARSLAPETRSEFELDWGDEDWTDEWYVDDVTDDMAPLKPYEAPTDPTGAFVMGVAGLAIASLFALSSVTSFTSVAANWDVASQALAGDHSVAVYDNLGALYR